MIVRSCRFLAVSLAAGGLFLYVIGCPAAIGEGIAQRVGTWDLTMLDDADQEVGTGTFDVGATGAVTGTVALAFLSATATVAQADATISGTVSASGAFAASLEDASGNAVASLSGTLEPNTGAGSWTRTEDTEGGDWTATRREATPTPVAEGTPTPTPEPATPTPTPTATPSPTPTPTPPPVLSISPDTLALSDQAPSGTVAVSNTGESSLEWLATSDQTWLTTDPVSGSVPVESSQNVTVSADTSVLPVGESTGTVTFTSNGGNQELEVTVTVTQTNIIIQ